MKKAETKTHSNSSPAPLVVIDAATDQDLLALPSEKESPVTKDEDEIRVAAVSVREAYVSAVSGYADLVTLIRAKNNLLPQMATRALLVAGFSRSFASQLLRVAYADDDTYGKFLSGVLSFRAALQTARENSPKVQTEAKRRKAIENAFLMSAHRWATHKLTAGKPLVRLEDTDFVAVIPGAADELKSTGKCTVKTGKLVLTIERQP